jgi:hypothetical protein
MTGDVRSERKLNVIVESGQYAQITNVSIVQQNGELIVSGKLRQRSKTRRQTGHVHITILDSEGRVIRKTRADSHPNMFSRQSSITPRFSTSILLDIPIGAEIRLHHHSASYRGCSF